jgi:NAD(P)H-flavin reductase
VVESRALGGYRLLTVLDTGGPRPQPGQFYMLSTAERWGSDGERPYLPRAFSHARVREEADGLRLDFLLEDVGPGTERLAAAEPGEAVRLVGPLGIGFARPGGSGALLVGGGIGAAPILALGDDLGPEAPVMLGFRNSDYAEAASLFEAEPAIATDDGSAGRHGLVTELLREALDSAAAPTVFACGPPPMLEAVRALCAEREVAAQLAMESGMACGFGACFGCVVPTRDGYLRLCVDGPVIEAARLETALVAGAGH